MTKKEFFLPIFVGIIGVFGTLGGVLVTNYQTSKTNKENQLFSYNVKIIDQRINLIDRTAKIFGQSPRLQEIWNEYIKMNKMEDKSINDRLSAAQGEFQSVVFLAAVTFGPKTKKALKELSDIPGPWWTKPKDKQDNLLVAMSDEIQYELIQE